MIEALNELEELSPSTKVIKETNNIATEFNNIVMVITASIDYNYVLA